MLNAAAPDRPQAAGFNGRDRFRLVHVVGVTAYVETAGELIDQRVRDWCLARQRLLNPRRSGVGIYAGGQSSHGLDRTRFPNATSLLKFMLQSNKI